MSSTNILGQDEFTLLRDRGIKKTDFRFWAALRQWNDYEVDVFEEWDGFQDGVLWRKQQKERKMDSGCSVG